MRKHGLIGAPVSRIDGPLKVQGQARFAAEVPIDGIAAYDKASQAMVFGADSEPVRSNRIVTVPPSPRFA